MGLPVRWTPSAKKNLDSIKRYLSEEWNDKVAVGFENRVQEFIEVLADFPNMGSIEDQSKGIRGFQIVKQVRVFYRVKSNEIIVLALFESRGSPIRRIK